MGHGYSSAGTSTSLVGSAVKAQVVPKSGESEYMVILMAGIFALKGSLSTCQCFLLFVLCWFLHKGAHSYVGSISNANVTSLEVNTNAKLETEVKTGAKKQDDADTYLCQHSTSDSLPPIDVPSGFQSEDETWMGA